MVGSPNNARQDDVPTAVAVALLCQKLTPVKAQTIKSQERSRRELGRGRTRPGFPPLIL